MKSKAPYRGNNSMRTIPHTSIELIERLDLSIPKIEAHSISSYLRDGEPLQLLRMAAQRELVDDLLLKLESPKGD